MVCQTPLNLLILLVAPSAASLGDRAPEFLACVGSCFEACDPVALHPGLRLLGWSCESDCRYECSQRVTARRVAAGESVLQYYGKWPFIRILGLQEFVSVVASIANGVPHALHLFSSSRRRLFAPAWQPLRSAKLFASGCGVNTWLWSAVFHARDTWVTERLDYHCATLLLVTYLWIALWRVGEDALPVQQRARVAALSLALLLIWLARHVYFLNTVRFDYGYNMKANGVLFIAQAVVWVVWAVWKRRRPHAIMIVRFQVLLTAAATFEILDFAPSGGILDAHAVWHALTVGLGFYWYSFLKADVLWSKLNRGEQDPFPTVASKVV